MSRVNENVVAALKLAISEVGQPKEVAQRLVSWLEALATGNTVITDNNEATNRISDLLDLVQIPSQESDWDEVEAEENEA